MKFRTAILPIFLASATLLANGCALLKRGNGTPAITAGKNQPPPLASKLRDNFGVTENRTAPASANTAPTAQTAPPPSVPAATTATSTATGPYKMRSGDTVLVNIRIPGSVRNELPQEDIIDDSGMINFPLIGRMLARGKTTSEFEQEVERAYIEGKFYKNVTVNVVIPQRFVFVTGEVRQSNKVPLVSGLTLYGAISSAGGLNDWGDPARIQLIRGGNTTLHNLAEIVKDPTKDTPLEAGDQIVVPRRRW